MKHYFILLLLFCACTVSAQNTRPIRFGVGVYPNFSNAFVTSKVLRSSFDDQGKWFVTPGIFAEKGLNNRWSCRTGVQYQRSGHRSPETDLTWGSEFATGQYVPDPNLSKKAALEFNYSFLVIPIDFIFKIKENKPFFFTAGLTPLIHLSSQSTIYETYLDAHKTTRTSDISLKPLGVGLNLGIGRTFALSEHWALDIQPTFRVVQLYTQLSYKRLYDTGIWFGIKRK